MAKKEVEMQAEQPKKKLTYEELENVCHQLSEQSRTLYQKLQEANMTNIFKRLDYLFAVLENKNVFPEEFVKACVEEVITSITIPKEEEEKSEE